MTKSIFYLILSILIFSSCQNLDEDNDIIQILPKSILDNAKLITPIHTSYISSNNDVSVFILNDDYILTKSKKCEYIINLYKLSDKDYYKPIIKYGSDTNGFLSATIGNMLDSIIIYDFVKYKFTIIPTESLYNSNKQEIIINNTNILSQYLLPYKKCLLFLNPYCFKDRIGKFSNPNQNRFLISDSNYNYNLRDIEYKYETFNIVRGKFIINYKKNRIIYLNEYEDYIEIFNTNLSKIKKIEGPNNLTFDYIKFNNGFSTELLLNNISVISYSSCCYNNDFVYLAYIGSVFKQNNIYAPSYIFKIDWDGNIINSYYTTSTILNLSISKINDQLYSWEKDRDGNKKLVKYIL